MLSSCTAYKSGITEIKPPQQPEAAEVSGNLSKSLFYEPYEMVVTSGDYSLSLYEPEMGCYLGAYILSNKMVDYSIENFEKTIKRQHCLYAYNMSSGDDFPLNWVLECVSNMKTPYFSLNVNFPITDKEMLLLEQTAMDMGDFYVPMFVEVGVNTKVSAKKYTDDFKKIKSVFNRRATNVAIVWSVKPEDIEVCEEYYPGYEYTDWVSLQIIETIDKDKGYSVDAIKAIDTFYGKFQRQKPVIISRFAVSHLNSGDFVYKTDIAAKEIERVYEEISNKYSRIKAVIYYDFNGMDFNKKDDFTITGEEALINAYSNAASNPRFINELDLMSYGDIVEQSYISGFTSYKKDGSYYVSSQALSKELGVTDFRRFGDYIVLNGTVYYNISEMQDLKNKISFVSSR